MLMLPQVNQTKPNILNTHSTQILIQKQANLLMGMEDVSLGEQELDTDTNNFGCSYPERIRIDWMMNLDRH